MEKSMRTQRDGRTFIVEYFGTGNDRSARIYTAWRGYSVDLIHKGQRIDTVEVWDHTREYAEDTAENWIMEIIK